MEIEAKFYVRDLKRVQSALDTMGAELVQPRSLEENLRFDLPDARLRGDGRVLRLRRDGEIRLTYKGPSRHDDGILRREEIELTVDDFEQARLFLEGLGYEKLIYYEKYRTTYHHSGAHIMLDELPYGNFVEIEGQEDRQIRNMADGLGFRWAAAIGAGYHDLFDRARRNLKLSRPDLSFESFRGVQVQPADLDVQPADE